MTRTSISMHATTIPNGEPGAKEIGADVSVVGADYAVIRFTVGLDAVSVFVDRDGTPQILAGLVRDLTAARDLLLEHDRDLEDEDDES